MKPSSFVYHAPATVDEAVALLARLAPEDARVLAGGQSLVPMMNLRLAAPPHLIDINRIDSLKRAREEDGELVIPAGVRHAAFETPITAGPLGRLFSALVSQIAHHPIRTRGTFCGSLAHADPSSEWCLAATTLNATLVVRSTHGERRIAAAEFFTGSMMTALAPNELLVEARFPLLPQQARFGFYEVSRRAGDFAMAMALVVWQPDQGRILHPRIGVGGAEPKPRRIGEAEAVLTGRSPDAHLFARAGKAAADALCDVLEDVRTTAEFRRDLVRTVVLRALERGNS